MWGWLLLFLLLWVSGAYAQFPVNGGRIDSQGDLSSGTVATSGGAGRALNTRFKDRLNLLDYTGAAGDGAGYSDGIMNASSSTLNSTHVTFTTADVGKLIFVSGTGAAGVPQSGTITGIVDSHDVTVSFTASTTASPTTFVYGTNNTAPYIAMLNDVNSANPSRKVGYIPGGNYLMKLTGIPVLSQSGVVCDAPWTTKIYIDPTTSGQFISWSEAWGGVATGGVLAPDAADIETPNNANQSPVFVGCSIMGSKTATVQQDAIVLYDRDDKLVMHDVWVQNLQGRCFSVGQTKNKSQAYMRESTHLALTCFNTGTASVPAVEISSTSASGSDATNEVGFDDLHIFGSTGVGLAIRNPNNFSATRQIHIGYLRIEKSGSDNFDINLAGDAGIVENVQVDDYESISNPGSTAGFAILSSSAGHPVNIAIQRMYEFTSTSSANGINIQDGQQVYVGVGSISVPGTVLTIGSGIQGTVRVVGYGAENTWTTSIDPTKEKFIQVGSSVPYALNGSLVSGRFYMAPTGTTPGGSAVTAANRLFVTPVFVNSPSLVKTLAFDISAGNAGTFNSQMCIFADNGTGLPGALVPNADTGEQSITANATGSQSFTVNGSTGVMLPGPQWYWVGFMADSTAESVFSALTGASGSTINNQLGQLSATAAFGGSQTTGMYMAQSLGTCPSNFNGSPTMNTGAATPLVVMGF